MKENESDPDLRIGMQRHLDNLTKPVGSLGELETLAVRLAEIQGRVPPRIRGNAVFVFAGDHGITAEGVSLYPQEVTRQMVLNFLGGGAAINVLARECGFDLFVVDTGIVEPVSGEGILECRVGAGTVDFLTGPAMSEAQLEHCLANGRRLADMTVERNYDLVAVGDMGIGNTTSAAGLLVAAGFPPGEIVDRGTGIPAKTLDHKRRVIEEAVGRHAPFERPEHVLQRLGGFELATMAGYIGALAGRGVACVIDGFPVTAAAYMALSMDEAVGSYLFAGHRSKVKGHDLVLKKMGLKPIVDFGMRLGEGTGAVMGGWIIGLAAALAGEMASFEGAHVSRSDGVEENY